MRRLLAPITLLVGFAISGVYLAACGSGDNGSVAQPTVTTLDVSDVGTTTVGDIRTAGASLELPGGSFGAPTAVTMETLSAARGQALVGSEFELLGMVVSVGVDGQDHVRLDQRAVLSIEIPRSGVKSSDEVYAAYHDGQHWELFLPDSVDLGSGTVRIGTYHFSEYAAAKLNREQQLKLFATQMATNSWSREEQNKNFINATQEYVNELFAKTLGIQNTNVTRIVLQSIVKENDFGALMVNLTENDLTGFNTKFSEIAGKALLAHMDLDEGFMSDATTVTTAYSQAAAELGEGKTTAALKALSTALLEANTLGKIFSVGVKVTDTAIKDWRDKSIEDAYQAYKNGSDRHGYDVDARDFQALLAQMRGIGHKIYSDGIAAHCRRAGVKQEQLTQAQLQAIRSDVERRLKNEFDSRIAEEAKTDGAIAHHQKIIAAFERNLLLQHGSFRYDSGMSLELRLHRLYNVMNQVVDHTGLKLTTSATAATGEITIDEVCLLIGDWYTDASPTKDNYFAKIRKLRGGGATIPTTPQTTASSYAWVLLSEVKDYPNEAKWTIANQHESYRYEPSYARGTYSSRTIFEGKSDDYLSPPKVNGEAFAAQAQWSAAPSRINPDQTVSLTFSIQVTEDSQSFFSFSASTTAFFDQADITPGSRTSGAVEFVDANKKSWFQVDRKAPSFGGTLSAKPRGGSKSGDRMVLLMSYSSMVAMGTGYLYEWQPVK
jgi:hypothetical protein